MGIGEVQFFHLQGTTADEATLATNTKNIEQAISQTISSSSIYTIDTAKVNNADLPLVKATQNTYAAAIKQGYGADNITGIAQLYS